MSDDIQAGNCSVCGSNIRCGETCYKWFRRFVKVFYCSVIPCKSRTLCLICKNYIDIKKHIHPIAYFIHILSHYGLNVDYIQCINPITYTINNVYANTQNAYSYVPQLLFVSVEQITKHRYLELTDIQCRVKDSAFSCLICDGNTFYETFPTLEVVVSHLLKVHVNQSAVIGGLPKLIDFISDVDFK